ncbi:MAG TPA: DUF1697 domain-containing protein [Gemmatimonadaceae bacterium]
MTECVALLRGINVGGNRKIAMADLGTFFTRLGFTDVSTLLQTGNVVFQSPSASAARLERKLEEESAKVLGLTTDFFVRTAREWKALVADNPFPDAAARDPSHLVLMCLKASPSANQVASLRKAIVGRELVEVRGHNAYIVYPDGIGTSRLTNAVLDRQLGTRGTGRNWNTVLKLATELGVG